MHHSLCAIQCAVDVSHFVVDAYRDEAEPILVQDNEIAGLTVNEPEWRWLPELVVVMLVQNLAGLELNDSDGVGVDVHGFEAHN